MKKYYYTDKDKKQLDTHIVDIFERDNKCFVKFEDSLFYPQGGGQKGDRGFIEVDGKRFAVANSIKDEFLDSISLLEVNLDKKYLGMPVHCSLDWEFRYRQMRLHTALHLYHSLIAEISHQKLDNPILSIIEDGYALNKYEDSAFDISVLDEVSKRFRELTSQNIEVTTYPDSENPNYRYWKCLDFLIPCGGVHIDNLREIGDVYIEITHKKRSITVKITLR